MWSRRAFLQHASLGATCMAVFDVSGATTKTGPLGKPIGIQLYTVASDAANDLEGTLKTLADIGYREVEFAGGPSHKTATQLRTLLADLGLSCPSIHTSMAELQSDAQERIDFARALGAHYLVCSFPWTADGRFNNSQGNIAAGITLDDWKWNAEQLNRVGALAKRAGVRLGYHNHNLEFRAYNGVIGFDELLRLTDPELVTIELDIAWVVTAGSDPLDYLREHGARIELLHIKEVRKDLQVMTTAIKAQTTELGKGLIDWPKLFTAMNPQHIRHYFVEQENFEGSPLEAAKANFEYLHRLGSKQ